MPSGQDLLKDAVIELAAQVVALTSTPLLRLLFTLCTEPRHTPAPTTVRIRAIYMICVAVSWRRLAV